MKKITFFVLVLFIIMVSACVKRTVPLPSWETEEDHAIAQAWETKVETVLQAGDITKVEYVRDHFGEEARTYFTQDSTLIKRWEMLISKFRCSVVPYQLYVGGAAISVTFYKNDQSFPMWMGHPTRDILVIEEGMMGEDCTAWKMLRIDNYAEVKDEFYAILKEMGVPDSNMSLY